MIIFTIIGVIIVGIVAVSFLMGMAGKPATPILNAIDKLTGINNPNYSTKEILNELQHKIEVASLNLENTENYQDQSITENSIKLARLLLDAEKYQVKIYAEDEGKMHLSKVFSELIEHEEMQINHDRKIQNLSAFIEGNFRDSIKMEFIINNAKEMAASYVRQYAQAAYKNQSVDKI
jgi:hypothetical protein